MQFALDHAAFAWSSHESVVEAITAFGLTPRVGGDHADGTTRMSLLPFRDGSYLELIAPTPETAPGETVRWPAPIADDAGPCAWCLRFDDIVAAATSFIERGEPIVGPQVGGRTRPDGVRIEWDELFVGPETDRHALPFGITDRTPRSRRIPPKWVHGGPITGFAAVVVAVSDLESWVDRFRRLFRLPTPAVFEDEHLDARVASFPGRPIAFASPRSPDSPLASRLDRYPQGPCAYLFSTGDGDAAAEAYAVGSLATWDSRRIAWAEPPFETVLGVVERAST
ncbi:VOC family protein [Haloferacaceae archaeon DSL9]